jgi:hypothetical protein
MLADIAEDQQEQDVKELQAFLYILIRDHLPSGIVHGILIDHTSKGQKGDENLYSNPFLAAEALKIAQAILGHCTFQDILRPEGRVSVEELQAIRSSQLPQTQHQAYEQMIQAQQIELGNDPRDW